MKHTTITAVGAALLFLFGSTAMAQTTQSERNRAAEQRLSATRLAFINPTLSQCRAYESAWDADDTKWTDDMQKSGHITPGPVEFLSVDEIDRRIELSKSCERRIHAEWDKAIKVRPMSVKQALTASDLALEEINAFRTETELWREYRSRTDAVIGDNNLWEQLLLQAGEGK